MYPYLVKLLIPKRVVSLRIRTPIILAREKLSAHSATGSKRLLGFFLHSNLCESLPLLILLFSLILIPGL